MSAETERAAPATRDPKEILRLRAQALARPRVEPAASGEMLELLEFGLAAETYAVETRFVAEVYPLKELTPVPCTPSFIRGVVNVRGRLVAVIDIKRFFGLEDRGLTDLHRVILVRGSDLEFGLLADITVGVRNIHAAELQPPLPTLTPIATEYVKGLTAERLVVLDVARIAADPRIVVDEQVES